MPQDGTSVRPYQDIDDGKKAQIRQMFNRIAPYYDFLNRFLSLGIDTVWRKNAIRSIRPNVPERILDVATGTADLAIECVKQFPDAKVTGLDLAADMLNIGRRKVDKRSMTDQIELIEGDSEALPFDDDTFDAVTVAFGVRNFENHEKGLREMHRVLRKGGRLVVLEFSRPRRFPIKQMFNIYFKHILPVIGRIRSKDPRAYRYLYESVQVFPDYDNFVAVLESLGYRNCRWKAQTLGICCIYLGEK